MASSQRILAIAVLAAALGASAMPLSTQAQPAQATKPPAAAPTDEGQQPQVKDEDINHFAAAATEIRQLNEKWLPRVKAAGQQGAAAQQQVKQQALSEMTQAVEKNGLTVAKYNEIYELAQANPDVRKQVQDKMQPNPDTQNDDEEDNDQ